MNHAFRTIRRAAFFGLLAVAAAGSLRADTLLYVSVYNEFGPGADILKVDRDGTAAVWNISWDAGQELFDPEGMALDAAGNLYVNDGANIYKIDSAGNGTTFATKPSAYYADGLAIDGAGNVYALGANGFNYAVHVFNPAGVSQGFWELPATNGLVMGADGYLYGAEGFSGSVGKYTTAGVRTGYSEDMNFPMGLAFDPAGNLYVSGGPDVDDHDILYKIAPGGGAAAVFGSTGGYLTRGLAADAAGNIYSATQFCGCEPGPLNWIMVTDSLGNTAGFTALADEQRPNSIVVVPEPSACALLALGALFLLLSRRFRRPA